MPPKEIKPDLDLREKKHQLAIHLNNAARHLSAFADVLSKAVSEAPIDESTVDRLTELVNAVTAKPSRKRKLVALEIGEDGAPRKKKRERKVKDPNAPKGPASAYLLFQNDIRSAYKKEHPDMTNKDLLKLIGEQWKTLADEKKDYYREQHGKAKKKHEVDLAAYNSQNPEPTPPEPSENGKKKQRGVPSDSPVIKEVVGAASKATKKVITPKASKVTPKSRAVVVSSDSGEDVSEVEDSDAESPEPEPVQTTSKAASEESESGSDDDSASSVDDDPSPPPKKSRK